MLLDSLVLADNSQISRMMTDQRGLVFPVNPKDAFVFEITQDIEGYAKGIYIYSESNLDWFRQNSTERNPYDIPLYIPGLPKAGTDGCRINATRTIAIEADFLNSVASVKLPASGSTEFELLIDRDGVEIPIGEIAFTEGNRNGVFRTHESVAGHAIIVMSGDIIILRVPDVVDLNLEGLAVTICSYLAII